MKNLGRHHWLAAALMAQGYDKPVADEIAMRYLLGRTLFWNERADAVRAMTTLNFAPRSGRVTRGSNNENQTQP